MTSKRLGVSSNSKALREAIFGPPPILKGESREQYDLLLERLYADLKPTDIIEESWLHDLAYWIWELRRWRRMRVCLVEAATPRAMLWVLAAPVGRRLAYIGETHKVDAEKLSNARLSEAELKDLRGICDELNLESEEPNVHNVGTIRTRAFLEESDFVAHIDRQIVNAENRRNAIYREIDRHRTSIGFAWREKIRNIEEA
jgi:hypothetical protein